MLRGRSGPSPSGQATYTNFCFMPSFSYDKHGAFEPESIRFP
jgi:hypothetical protein